MKTIIIDYPTLKFYFFASNFKQPLTVSEVYYKKLTEGWEIQFFKNNFYIKCSVTHDDLMKEEQPLLKPIPGMDLLKQMDASIHGYENDYMKKMDDKQKEEVKKNRIAAFEVTFLKDAIKVLNFEGE